MEQLTTRAGALADDLAGHGMLTTALWRRALREVPRHLFVPPRGWALPDNDGGAPEMIDRDADPVRWHDVVYSDTAVVLQADDGATDPATGQGAATSSISAPGIVIAFLELLNVRAGDRVLEIGTGSGWTAALLSWRTGDRNVTTIEIDEEVAAVAARNLKAAGYAPHLITGDGADGWPDGAPYDRIHATCAVRRIPYPWIQQARPGGVIVLPWSPDPAHGYRVRLDVHDDGTATGRFYGPATYMMLRSQRQQGRWHAHHSDAADRSTTRLDPRTVAHAGAGAHLAITARVPGLGSYGVPDDDGGFSLLLFEPGHPHGSWAACDYTPDAREYEVHQYGDRRLWDEVADAYQWWTADGQPGPQRFGITVARGHHYLWVDDPAHTIGSGP